MSHLAYPWHESSAPKTCFFGVLTSPDIANEGPRKPPTGIQRLTKQEVKALVLQRLKKAIEQAAQPQQNDQVAKVGSSSHFAKITAPFGTTTPGQKTNIKFYQGLEHKGKETSALLAHHGYQAYYAGGKHGKADLANKNYQSKNLMIWDPSAGSGGEFGDEAYSDVWRRTHELGHALTLDTLNQKYGEGRRMGALGKHRTVREAKRAVEWESLAAEKQRSLLGQIGVHISDEDYNRERNTVMSDAVHRAVTGKFTEPADEGFTPHSHHVPLEVAHRLIDEHAAKLGLQSEHDLLPK